MECIIRQHQLPCYSSRLTDRYFGGLRMGVFDIETMGLNPASAEVILAGFLEVSGDGTAVARQYFAENKNQERELLLAVQQELQRYDMVLTYNGKHFDLPFIEKRAALRSVSLSTAGCYNLDLYLVLHGHSNLKSVLKNLRQKTVEDYMGLNPDRKDEISGAESIQLYESYLREAEGRKKEALKEKVLLHNHDDLLQLYRLLPILQQTDLHRAMSYLGFPVAGRFGWPQLNLSRIRIDYRGLSFQGTYGGPGVSYLSYDDGRSPFSCQFTPEGEFQFLIATRRHKGSHYLQLSDFFESDSVFCRYPGYENGFLILTQGNSSQHLEINMFVQTFLQHFMETIPCPLT